MTRIHPTTPLDGTTHPADDGYMVRFERHLAHPVARVWAALTEPTRIAEWLGAASVDLTMGGAVSIGGSADDDFDEPVTGEITELSAPGGSPPAVLAYTWGDPGITPHETSDEPGHVRWELTPTAEGTSLVFTHTTTATGLRGDLSAGWHDFLDRLGAALDGRPGETGDQWSDLRDRYQLKYAGGPTEPDGTLERLGDGYQLRFERHVRHPVATVWAAVTEPRRLAAWIGAVQVDLTAGGRYELHFGGDPSDVLTGVVATVVPPPATPAVFEHTVSMPDAPDGILRWELTPAEAGTRLVLTHTLPTAERTPSLASGWHVHVGNLCKWLAELPFERNTGAFHELRTGYETRFGVA